MTDLREQVARAIASVPPGPGQSAEEWMLSRADAALAAMPGGGVPAGWTPIETAPRDGTDILAWRDKLDPGDSPMMEVVYWHRDGKLWCVCEPWCRVEPTHWHPLPAAPTPPAAAEETDHA